MCLLGYSAFISNSGAFSATAKSGGLTAGVNKNATPQKEKKYGKRRDCPNCSPPGNQVLYIPLTDLPEAQGGELVFNSRSPKEMEVTPTFYKLDGTAVIGDPILVQSAEIRYVDFKKLLPAGHREEHDWGGLSLSYYGIAREMWAQFRLLGINSGGSVDEFFIVKDELRSDVQEAAWWMPRKSTAIIALGNVTDALTSAMVSFGNGDVQTLSLEPHATGIIRHKMSGAGGPESVAINITGMPGSIIPTGVIASKDGSFNSVIRFYDTKRTKQPHLFANGLRLAGVTPHMILKNTSTSPITAQPKFITSGGTSAANSITLPNVTLEPHETTEVDLTPLSLAARNRQDLDVVSIQVTNSGEPGSLIGSLYGIDGTGVSYDAPLRDSGPARAMTGSYPWKVSQDFTTVVYITNITDEPAEFVGEINYSGGHYLLDARKLAPGETAVFDMREVRERQEQNRERQKMAKDKSLGQFKWAVRGDTKGKQVLIGRAEMVSRSQQISTSYSCNDPCPPYYGASINPFPPPIIMNGFANVSIWEIASYDSGYSIGPYGVVATWTLADNAMGTLNPSEAHTTTFTGAATGSAFVDGFVGMQSRYTWDGRDCYYVSTDEEGAQAEVVVVSVTLTSTGTQEVGKPTHFLALKGSGNVTITATLDPASADPSLITWTGGTAGSDNLHRIVNTSSAADTDVTATVDGHSESVLIHVIDATAPPAAAVNAPKTFSSGGSANPGTNFGLTVVTIGVQGVVRPTYHVDPFFASDRWVFRLGDVSHSYKLGTNSQGRINLPTGNPSPFPLAAGLNLTESHTEARDDLNTAGLSGEGPRRRSYWVDFITQNHEEAHVSHFYSASFWLNQMGLFESNDVEASTVSVIFNCTDSTTTTGTAAVTKITATLDTAITNRHNAADTAEIPSAETFAHGVSNPQYAPIRNAIPIP